MQVPSAPSGTAANFVTTRKGREAFEQRREKAPLNVHWHRLSDAVRSEKKDMTHLTCLPSIFEVPPVMQPRFETTLCTLVDTIVQSQQQFAVVCMPSFRRVSQRCTWVSHWNRRFSSRCRFVTLCLCELSPYTVEHRHVLVGTNVELPRHGCQQPENRGSTTGMSRRNIVTVFISCLLYTSPSPRD